MLRDPNHVEMSELEEEFEYEMDEDRELFEANELEVEDELEAELEDIGDYEEEEPQEELEAVDEELSDYADRFYELSQRGYESEGEADEEVNGLLNELERDYFFKSAARRLLKNKRLRRLAQKGLKLAARHAAGQIPALKAFQGITQLARGNLKGALAPLAKAALTSAVPGAAAALPALQALGFEATEDPEANREAWDNYVEVAREAFEHLAQNLNERADEPLEASRLATNAFKAGMRRVQTRIPTRGSRRRIYGMRSRRGVRRVIRVRSGERVLIIGG